MLTQREVFLIKKLQGKGLGGSEIIKRTGFSSGSVYYWMNSKTIPKKGLEFYREENRKLRNRVIELESKEFFEDKLYHVKELVKHQPYEYKERFERAKAKHFKADEMLSDLRIELLKKKGKEDSSDTSDECDNTID